MTSAPAISFKDKTALVTGATRGIGRAIARLLEQCGAHVIVTGTKAGPSPETIGKDYWPLDLSNDTSTAEFCKRLEALPRLDVLVNNAGINKIEPVDELSSEQWDRILKVNLTGAMLLTRSAARVMKRQKDGGRIVNVSSIFGIVSRSWRNAYSATKFGLNGLTKSSALDLASHKILVNAVCPGFTLTDMTRGILSKKDMDELNQLIPLGRFAEEDEIARAAVFLCSDWNTYMTGETVIVDGGFVSR